MTHHHEFPDEYPDDYPDDEEDAAKDESKTCRYCGAEPLFWDHTHYFVTGRWRLIDRDGQPHRCNDGIPPLED